MSNNPFTHTRAHFPVGVNTFVIKEGKLLLGKRKDARYHDGEWGLPGGHLEQGEQVTDAAKRELEEETGLHAEHCVFTIVNNDVRADGNQYIHFGFRVEDFSGELENNEPDKCYGWEWFPLEQLPTPLFIGHRKLIEAFLRGEVFNE